MAKKATKPSKATHSGELKIGEQTIPCYVLEDGTRVITQRGLQRSVGMSMSGGTAGAHRMSRFVANLESKGVKAKELALRIDKPILFYPPKTGRVGYGYEASILPEICEFILRCRDADILTSQQQHIAIQSDVLMRALAHVGIIALVDEATGYQYDRARKALEKILEDFIAKELVKWAKRFPDEFYEQMFRLRGWPYDPSSVRRPGHPFAKIITLLFSERG